MSPNDSALWRRRKLSRTEWRKKIVGKKRIQHGGRGKIYGLKSRKRRRKKLSL